MLHDKAEDLLFMPRTICLPVINPSTCISECQKLTDPEVPLGVDLNGQRKLRKL